MSTTASPVGSPGRGWRVVKGRILRPGWLAADDGGSGYPPPSAVVPPLSAVRAWTGVSERAMDDTMLQGVIDAEAALQAQTCLFDPDPAPYPPELVQALYRRVAREVAARGLPLGLTDVSAEFGPAALPAYDVEIARLEATRRRVVVA